MGKKRTAAQQKQSAKAKRRYEKSLHQKVQGTVKLTPLEILQQYSVQRPNNGRMNTQ